MEAVGIHDITEKLRVRRAEPAVKEDGKERVPSRVQPLGVGGKHPRARMRSRLRRPEEAVLVPQHHRLKLRGGRRRLLPKRLESQRPRRFQSLPPPPFPPPGPGGGRKKADGGGGAGGFSPR